MQKQEFLYTAPNHAANLNNMRFEDKWCDVTIEVNGKEIRAHKVILAANLKYFAAMLSNDSFQESKQGVINMESVEETALEAFVSFAYTGEILLTESNALNMLMLANYLSEDGIKKACVEYLQKNLKVEEACQAYEFSNTIGCLSLNNAAKAKIVANFGDCSKSSNYLKFNCESLMGILSNGKNLSIELQTTLFEGIIRWIKHDAKHRKMCMKDLLSSIHISKLNAGDITSCLFKNLEHCNYEYGITKDALFYYEANKIEHKEQKQVFMMISKEGSVRFYNFIERKWSQEQVITNAAFDPAFYISCAALDDKLYYIYVNSSGENCLVALDPSSMENTTLHFSSSILSCATLCACNGFLYIFGGKKQDGSVSDQVLRYDPQTNSLKTLASMRNKRWGAASVFYQGCLYVLGGWDGSASMKSVEKYDPVRDEWTAATPMCENRHGHAVAELSGKLYACGSYPSGGTVEVYDPATNSWQLLASMNEARRVFIVVAREDKLLAIGGGRATAEVYDPSEDQWRIDHEMSSGLKNKYCKGGLFPSGCIAST